MTSCRPRRMAPIVHAATFSADIPPDGQRVCRVCVASVSSALSTNSLRVVLGLTNKRSIPSPANSARNASLSPWKRELARTVLTLVRNGPMPQYRADVDDQRPTARSQHGERDTNQRGRSEKVDLHHPPQSVFLGTGKRTDRSHSGVVDQDVESPPGLVNRLHQPSRSDASVMSPATQMTCEELAGHAAATAFSRSSRRAVSSTCAPWRSRLRASSRPMPLDAPVTRTCAPFDRSGAHPSMQHPPPPSFPHRRAKVPKIPIPPTPQNTRCEPARSPRRRQCVPSTSREGGSGSLPALRCIVARESRRDEPGTP